MTTYSFNKSVSFPNGINTTQLTDEITDSSSIAKTLVYVNTVAPNDVDINFSTALSTA